MPSHLPPTLSERAHLAAKLAEATERYRAYNDALAEKQASPDYGSPVWTASAALAVLKVGR